MVAPLPSYLVGAGRVVVVGGAVVVVVGGSVVGGCVVAVVGGADGAWVGVSFESVTEASVPGLVSVVVVD
jgi:hypothetical protein